MADFQSLAFPTLQSPAKKTPPQQGVKNGVVNPYEQEKPLSTSGSNPTQSGAETTAAWNQWLTGKKPEISFAPTHQVSQETHQSIQEDSTRKEEEIAKLKETLRVAYGEKPAEEPKKEAEAPVVEEEKIETPQVEKKSEGGSERGTVYFGEKRESESVISSVSEKSADLNHENAQAHLENSSSEQILNQVQDDTERETTASQSSSASSKTELKPAGMVDFGFFFAKSGEALGKVAGPVIESVNKFRKVAYKQTKEFVGSFWKLLKENVFFRSKKKETPEQKAAAEKKKMQNMNKMRFFDTLRNMARGLFNPERKRAQRQKVESLNKQIGNKNLSYEGVVNQVTGEVLTHVLMDAEKANSKKSEEQIRQEKQAQLAAATKGKGKKGPGVTMSADKSHNFNNAAKLAG